MASYASAGVGGVIYGATAAPGFTAARTYVTYTLRAAPPAALLVILPVAVRQSVRPGGALSRVLRFGFQLGHTPVPAELIAGGAALDVPELPNENMAVALPPMWARDP